MLHKKIGEPGIIITYVPTGFKIKMGHISEKGGAFGQNAGHSWELDKIVESRGKLVQKTYSKLVEQSEEKVELQEI